MSVLSPSQIGHVQFVKFLLLVFVTVICYIVGHHFQHLSACMLVRLLFWLWLWAVHQIIAVSNFYFHMYWCCGSSVLQSITGFSSCTHLSRVRVGVRKEQNC